MATMMNSSSSMFGFASGSEALYQEQLPPSPTAALYHHNGETTEHKTIRRRSSDKSVSFATDVKTHDGLTSRNAVFDRLISAYFVEQREISELDVINLTGQNLTTVLELHQDLLDMAQRISEAAEEGKQCAPVLPRGGGLCTKLCVPHVPYVRVLDRVVEAAANRLVKAQSMAL